LLVATVVWQRRNNPTLQAPEPFKVGEQAERLPGVGYGDARISVILYLRSTCPYCTQSMPFYRRLSEEATRLGSVRLIAVSPETEQVARAYIEEHSLRVGKLIKFDGRPVPTPTLVTVNRTGTIQGVWVGQKNEKGETEILESIRSEAQSGN
jgi:hypothetical protein